MTFHIAAWTDAGAGGKKNQDSCYVTRVQIGQEEACLAVLADGMGGLSGGEQASAELVLRFRSWLRDTQGFRHILEECLCSKEEKLCPEETSLLQEETSLLQEETSLLQEETSLLHGKNSILQMETASDISQFSEALKASWMQQICLVNELLLTEGNQRGKAMGTTLAVLLLYRGKAWLMHVGDSRIYELKTEPGNIFPRERKRSGFRRLHGPGLFHPSSDGTEALLLTKDQSVVQQEVDAGRLTPQEARRDSRRNMLTECIGATGEVHPLWKTKDYNGNQAFLLCSDGLVHELSEWELGTLGSALSSEKKAKKQLRKLCEKVMSRGEKDNITAVLVWTD